MELLAEVGHDLPGAVTVLPLPGDLLTDTAEPDAPAPARPAVAQVSDGGRPRFSLAGVQLKLSMVQAGDRLVLPLGGGQGDWIVKFPDASIPYLPVVEHATMELARRAGIEVPQTGLPTRDELPDTPATMWTSAENRAFSIRRFDRGPSGGSIHMEDLAQVRNVWPTDKYLGSYESLAALIHRGRDTRSLVEMVRRLAFNVLVDNADAHLKNWSLLYSHPRRPVLSPAYDLVSVAPYPQYDTTMALRFNGTKRADQVRVAWFERLAAKIDIAAGELEAAAVHTIERAATAWPEVSEVLLGGHQRLRHDIDAMIRQRARSLLS